MSDSQPELENLLPSLPHPIEESYATHDCAKVVAFIENSLFIFFRNWGDVGGLSKDDAFTVRKFCDYGEKNLRSLLGNVALKMIEASAPEKAGRISAHDLRAILFAWFECEGGAQAHMLADGMLRLIAERSFILTRLDSGYYAFPHRAFLEYFIALAWATQFATDIALHAQSGKCPEDMFFEQIFLPRFHDDLWIDTFHFLIAMLPPRVARVCLHRLASLAGEDLAPYADNSRISPHDHQFAAKVFAAELARNVQPDSGEIGRSIGAREVIQPWKDALLAYAWSVWDPTYVMPNEGNRRGNLRRAAQSAIAALWCGEQSTIDALADRLLVPQESIDLESLGLDMATVAPGRSQLYFLLLDIIYAPCRTDFPSPQTPKNRLRQFTSRVDAADVRSRAISALAAGWSSDAQTKVAILRAAIGVPERELPRDEAGEVRRSAFVALQRIGVGDAELKKMLLRALIGVPNDGIMPDEDWRVRHDVIEALSEGWYRDPETKPAFIQVLIGVPGAGILPDNHWNVRRKAIETLREVADGDADVKAAFLRAAIGLPEAGVRPDKNEEVRRYAVFALGSGWSGDSEAKAALLRTAFGVPEAGIPQAKAGELRRSAIIELCREWSGDAEAKAFFLRMLVGVPEAGILPEADSEFRFNAITALGDSWSGDTEAETALWRVAFGVPESGILPDEDLAVRRHAIETLAENSGDEAKAKAIFLRILIGVPELSLPADRDPVLRVKAIDKLYDEWGADPEVIAALLRVAIGVPGEGIPPDEEKEIGMIAIEKLAYSWRWESTLREKMRREVEDATEKFGADHDDTRRLRETLEYLSRNDGKDGEK